MTEVFVDTWAWYALTDRADTDHLLAQKTNIELLDTGHTFVTSNFVLDETLTLIRYHVHHAAAVQYRNMLQQLLDMGVVRLIRVNEAHEAEAWRIFAAYSDQRFSYTDCTSCAVMTALKLEHVFTADRHFATMGFQRFPTQ